MPRPLEFWFSTSPSSFQVNNGELVVKSSVAFRFPNATSADMQGAIQARDQRGYKIGMRLPNGQQVTKFGFRGANEEWIWLQENPAVTQELQQVFAAVPNERWIGFVSNKPRRRAASGPDTIAYEDELRIAPFKYDPQLIPVVHTFGDDSFANHYILGVRVLGSFPNEVRAGVQAMV